MCTSEAPTVCPLTLLGPGDTVVTTPAFLEFPLPSRKTDIKQVTESVVNIVKGEWGSQSTGRAQQTDLFG